MGLTESKPILLHVTVRSFPILCSPIFFLVGPHFGFESIILRTEVNRTLGVDRAAFA